MPARRPGVSRVPTPTRARRRRRACRSRAGSPGSRRLARASPCTKSRLPRMLVRIGHSADPDDAFMVWALATGQVDAPGFEFELVPEDIQVLNEWALEGRLEVTALSLATYPLVGAVRAPPARRVDRIGLRPDRRREGAADAGRAARGRDHRSRP